MEKSRFLASLKKQEEPAILNPHSRLDSQLKHTHFLPAWSLEGPAVGHCGLKHFGVDFLWSPGAIALCTVPYT